MQETTTSTLVEQITEQLYTLSADELHTIQDFVAYLVWKRQQSEVPAPRQKSAEERAIERMNDSDDPSKWITVIEEGEEIDVEAVCQSLKERGFEIEVPN